MTVTAEGAFNPPHYSPLSCAPASIYRLLPVCETPGRGLTSQRSPAQKTDSLLKSLFEDDTCFILICPLISQTETLP